jgi:hypothetical protein
MGQVDEDAGLWFTMGIGRFANTIFRLTRATISHSGVSFWIGASSTSISAAPAGAFFRTANGLGRFAYLPSSR